MATAATSKGVVVRVAPVSIPTMAQWSRQGMANGTSSPQQQAQYSNAAGDANQYLANSGIEQDPMTLVIPASSSPRVDASTAQWFLASFLLSGLTTILLSLYIYTAYFLLTAYWAVSLSEKADPTYSYHDRVTACMWFFALHFVAYAVYNYISKAIGRYGTFVTIPADAAPRVVTSGANGQTMVISRDSVLGMSVYDLFSSVWNWVRYNFTVTRIVSIGAWATHESCNTFAMVLAFMVYAIFVAILCRSVFGMPFKIFPGSESVFYGPIVRLVGQYLDPTGAVLGWINSPFA